MIYGRRPRHAVTGFLPANYNEMQTSTLSGTASAADDQELSSTGQKQRRCPIHKNDDGRCNMAYNNDSVSVHTTEISQTLTSLSSTPHTGCV